MHILLLYVNTIVLRFVFYIWGQLRWVLPTVLVERSVDKMTPMTMKKIVDLDTSINFQFWLRSIYRVTLKRVQKFVGVHYFQRWIKNLQLTRNSWVKHIYFKVDFYFSFSLLFIGRVSWLFFFNITSVTCHRILEPFSQVSFFFISIILSTARTVRCFLYIAPAHLFEYNLLSHSV